MASFELGRLLATPGVLAAAEEAGDDLMAYLRRHARGDWGTVGRDDWRGNDRALIDGTRLLSAYLLRDGSTKVWIITERIGARRRCCCPTNTDRLNSGPEALSRPPRTKPASIPREGSPLLHARGIFHARWHRRNANLKPTRPPAPLSRISPGSGYVVTVRRDAGAVQMRAVDASVDPPENSQWRYVLLMAQTHTSGPPMLDSQ